MALTFSTLLSSQASGAHRAGTFFPAWGNSTYFTRLLKPSQLGLELPPHRSRRLRIGPLLEGARPDRWSSMPVGFLRVGRRRSRRSLVSCTPMRPCLLYAPDAAGSNSARYFPAAPQGTAVRHRPSRSAEVNHRSLGGIPCSVSSGRPPRICTIPGVRVPRRGLDYFRRPRWRAQAPLRRPSSCRAAGSRSGRATGRPAAAPRRGR